MMRSRKATFPGFQTCIRMMRRHTPHTQEDGFHWLLPRVEEHINELIAEFQKPENQTIQGWLLELIGHSRSEVAFALLAEQIRSENDSLREWAIRGLKHFGTKLAAQLLRDARSYQLASPRATQELRAQLNRIIGPEQPWEVFARTDI